VYVLVVQEPDGNETEYDLAGEVVLGRDETADIRLGDAAVSREHLRIFQEDGLCYLEDLGSANGTVLGGHPVVGAVVLPPSQVAKVGPFSLWIESSGGDELPPSQPATQAAEGTYRGHAPAPEGAPRLEGISGVAYGRAFDLGARSIVGREGAVSICLADPSVSRNHAELVVRGEQVLVRDLGSSNGSYVNDARVTQAEIFEGDRLRFGDVELIFFAGDSLESSQGSGELGSAQGSRLRPGSRPSGRGKGLDRKKKLLLFGGGALVLLFIVAALMKPKPLPPPPRRGAGSHGAANTKVASVKEETYTKMKRVRTLIDNSEWSTAEKMLRQIIDLDPINKDARDMLKSCELNKRMERLYQDGKAKMALGEDLESLKLFTKVEKESAYYEQAQYDVQGLIKTMLKKFSGDCKGNFSARKYRDAIRTCTVHEDIACQCPTLADETVTRALKQSEHYLHLRESERWSCPTKMSQWVPCAERGGGQDEALIKARYTVPKIQEAMLAYYQGQIGRTMLILQKMKASFSDPNRETAAELYSSMKVVEGKWKDGQSRNLAGDPEAAEREWKVMLTVDSRLMPEGARSYYKRESAKELAKAYYGKGQEYFNMERWADAFDWCSRGLESAPGDKKLKECIRNLDGQGAIELKRSFSCDEIARVLSMTRDTSPVHKQAVEMAAGRGCR